MKLLQEFRRSLAYKFALFALLAVVLPAGTIAASLIVIGRRALADTICSAQIETARRVSDRVSLHIDHVRSVLAIAAAEPGLAAFTRARQEESLRRLMRWQETFKEAILINAAGQETAKLTSIGRRFARATDLLSRRNRPEFTAPMREGGVYIGEPFFAGDRLPYLFASCPTYGRRSVLAARVRLDNLWSLVQEVKRGEPGIVYIVDRKGNLLAHPDPSRVQVHTNMDLLPIVREFMQGRSGRQTFGVYRNERGDRVVSLVQEVPELGWGVVMETPTAVAYEPIRRMEEEVLRWTAICTLIILAFAFWRVRQIVRPVELLEQGARKIAHGQLDLDLQVRTGDELETLARSFQGMANALKQLEELRRDLISMLVHDLKSPLSGIMGGIDYIQQNPGADNAETNKKVLGLARKSSEDLYQMIQNLLDVAKMEEGKLEPHYERVKVPALLEECAEPFLVQVQKENKTLRCDIDPGLPEVRMDRGLIRRVLVNLVSNAVRHTTSRGNIVLRARRTGQEAEIVVQDNGEGIQPEYREKIFDKFVQAERKRVHLRSGTGLGLAFCKMAIELHGGKIVVESEVGKGSAFKFTLPLRAPAPVPAAVS